MKLRFIISLFALAALPKLGAYDGQLAERDRLVLTSHKPDSLLVMDREGKVLWRSEHMLKHPQQVTPAADGRLFCATIDGAHLFSPEGECLWQYSVPEGAQNATALYLGEGRHLVAHEGRGELVELDSAGGVLAVTEVDTVQHAVHGQFRYVGFGDGNYLVPMTKDGIFREIKPRTGEVLWEVKDLNTVTSAIRTQDRGTYIAYHNSLARYDADRALQWTVKFTKCFGFKKEVPPTGMVELPGGNLLIAFWHSHENVPELIEFNPNTKKLVQQWDVPGVSKLGCVAVLPEGHSFLASSVK